MIIYDIARGLQYLHEDSPERIVHRDLKPQNILSDNEFKPKISDFGLGNIFVNNQRRIQHGARGAQAPPYPMNSMERRGEDRGKIRGKKGEKKKRGRRGLDEGEER